MPRHTVTLLVAFTLLAVPLAVEAQQAAKVPRIGWLVANLAGKSHMAEAFLQGLRDLGYVEGRNVVKIRDAEGKVERLPALAAELVALSVDVILAGGTAQALAAKQATKTIPIVFTATVDPVADGLVTSLARPGGNVTGVSSLSSELHRLARRKTVCVPRLVLRPLLAALDGADGWRSGILPAVANGVVYVGSRDNELYAFPTACSNPCSPLWTADTGSSIIKPGPVVSSPAVASGVVYVGSLGGNFFAFPDSCSNPCSPLWSFPILGGVASSPAVDGGRVFVGGVDGRLFAFPASCSNPCSPQWTAQTGGAIESSPAVANGVVYVGSNDGRLYAFPASCSNPCSPLWTAQTAIEITSSPAIAGGVVYVGSRGSGSSAFYAFPASCSNPCSPLWTAPISVSDSPAVANGVVFVGSEDGKLYAFPTSCSNPCTPLWSFATGDEVGSSPAIVGGVVYVGIQNKLAAFDLHPVQCGCAPLL